MANRIPVINIPSGMQGVLTGTADKQVVSWDGTNQQFVTSAISALTSGPIPITGYIVGTPNLNEIVYRYVAERTVTISTTLSAHKFFCVGLPGATCTLSVQKITLVGVVSTIMTINFPTTMTATHNNTMYQASAPASVGDNTLTANDMLVITATAVDAAWSTIAFSIYADGSIT